MRINALRCAALRCAPLPLCSVAVRLSQRCLPARQSHGREYQGDDDRSTRLVPLRRLILTATADGAASQQTKVEWSHEQAQGQRDGDEDTNRDTH
jgi:hypothetical protein